MIKVKTEGFVVLHNTILTVLDFIVLLDNNT